MSNATYHPSWRTQIRYEDTGPQPSTLVESGGFKSLLGGLEAGQKLPVHPEGLAVYYFLEGTGTMIVDGERFSVAPGAIVITPAGASRGLEAESRLAFLATRVADR